MKWKDVDISGWRVMGEGATPEERTALAIDEEIARSEPCPACGGQCDYIPLADDRRGATYRSFAVCRNCNEAVEF